MPTANNVIGPKLSIIVPFYKTEPFVRKCVQSIIEQTYKNIEIILVDDGSPDLSGKICDEFAQKDSRIKVIHKENGGVCAARNDGMDTATGEYISFVDGDDWLAPDFAKYMLSLVTAENSDMAISVNIFDSSDTSQVKEDAQEKWTPEITTTELLYPRIPIGPWNKIFKRVFLEEAHIKFNDSFFSSPTGLCGEGLYFITYAAQRASFISVGHRKVYHYRTNNAESATTKFDVQMPLNALNALGAIKRDLIIKAPMVADALKWHMLKTKEWLLMHIIGSNTKAAHKDLYNSSIAYIRQNTFSVLSGANISLKQKAKLVLMFICPILGTKLKIWRQSYRLKKDTSGLTHAR